MAVRRFAFLVLRQVVGLIGLGQSPDAKDVEIAVLRHQLAVLARGAFDGDGSGLAALTGRG